MNWRCFFGRHDWQITHLYKLAPGFARFYGNASVECRRCGKVTVRYAEPAQ